MLSAVYLYVEVYVSKKNVGGFEDERAGRKASLYSNDFHVDYYSNKRCRRAVICACILVKLRCQVALTVRWILGPIGSCPDYRPVSASTCEYKSGRMRRSGRVHAHASSLCVFRVCIGRSSSHNCAL